MTYEHILALIFALQIKHFLCDFPLQTSSWMYVGKGIYGHPGGFAHASLHMLGTLMSFVIFVDVFTAITVAMCDLFIHYHVDWAKVKINKHHGWECNKHSQFWVLLGVDQLIHQLTYIVMIWVIV